MLSLLAVNRPCRKGRGWKGAGLERDRWVKGRVVPCRGQLSPCAINLLKHQALLRGCYSVTRAPPLGEVGFVSLV